MTVRRLTMASVLLGLFAAAPSFAQNSPSNNPPPAPAAPAATPAPGGSSAPIPAAHIGVINLDKIFQDLQEAKDIRAKQEAEQTALKNSAQDHQRDLSQMKESRDKTLNPNSSQYEDATIKLETLSMQYESELKLKQLDMARSQNKLMKSVFEKVEAASQTIAKQKGLDLVISQVRPEFPPNYQELNPDNIRQMIQQRALVYVSPSLDVTSDVITAMDAAYKAGAK